MNRKATYTSIAFLTAAITSTVSAQPTFNWTSIDGLINVGGPGTAGASSSISLDSPFSSLTLNAPGALDTFASTSFSETLADASFNASAPDGSVVLDLNYTFSPTESADVIINWDFEQLNFRESAATVSLFNQTTQTLLFEEVLGPSSTIDSTSIPVTPTDSYTWSFATTVTARNEGAGSASISITPAPGSAALLAFAGLLTAKRKR